MRFLTAGPTLTRRLRPVLLPAALAVATVTALAAPAAARPAPAATPRTHLAAPQATQIGTAVVWVHAPDGSVRELPR